MPTFACIEFFAANEAGKRLKAAEDDGPKHPQTVYDQLAIDKADLHAHARALETHAATVCALSAHSFVSAATAIKGGKRHIRSGMHSCE
jgi:hypothetical protein